MTLTITLPPTARRVFRKRARESVSTWVERHVRLPSTITSREGPLRFSRSPYLRDPVDAWGELWLRRGVLCMAPQTGKTLGSYLPLLWSMDRAPAPAVLVLSDEDGARKMLGDYLTPIVRETRELRGLFSAAKSDATSHVLRLKNGMVIRGAWATSAAKLKSSPYRYAIGDEVDDWPLSAGARGGDPEALLDVRLRTYPKTSKLWLVSSPGGPGGIWAKLAACSQLRIYFAKCPACRAEQRLVWPRVKWPGDGKTDPAEVEGKRSARYLCAWCDAQWDDADRDRAVREGRWVAFEREALDPAHWDEPLPKVQLVPERRPVSVGWHLASWYSPLVSLSKCAADFLRANQVVDPAARVEALRAWTNNHPAKPWLDQSRPEVAEGALARLKDDRPAGVVPPWGLVLVLTADVQGDGVWYELRAWGTHRTSALVRYGFLARSVNPLGGQEAGDFAALAALLAEPQRQPDGTELPVLFALVDARYRTDEVYEWCRRHRKAAPAMGYEQRRVPIGYAKVDVYPGTGKAIPGGLQRVELDTNHFKNELSRRIEVDPTDPGAWLLTADVGPDYLAHFRSEARDPKTNLWVQLGGKPNHLWDCAVYQLAAAQVLEAQGVFARLAQAPAPPAPKPRPAEPRKDRMW